MPNCGCTNKCSCVVASGSAGVNVTGDGSPANPFLIAVDPFESADAQFARAQRLGAFTGLKAALADGSRSCAIQVIGDSTGNDTTDWVYRMAQTLAPLYPDWNVHYRLWSDSTQQFGASIAVQAAASGPRYLDCSTGATTRRLDASVSPYLSGVIDVRVKVSMTDWTPATQAIFCGKSSADPQRGWYFGVNSAGLLFFTYSTDGNAATLSTTFNNTGPNAWVDGQTYWARCIFNPNNGSSQRTYDFKVSTDGITWTSIGTQVVVAGAVTVFNNSATGFELGGVAAGVGSTGMKVYEVQIRNGADGPNVVPAIPDLWPPYNVSAAYFGGAPNLTFVNASYPGGEIGYLGDSTRLPKLTPNYGQLVTFLSDSHNEGVYVGRAWTSRYEAWRAAVEAQLPGVPTIILTQNPETSGTTWYREHRQRRLDLLAYARQKAVDYIDTYGAFIAAGWPGALMADAVHPNATGSDLWRDVVMTAFDAST